MTGVHEVQKPSLSPMGRNHHFFYVNEESIASVINRIRLCNSIRVREDTINFLLPVDAAQYLESCKDTEADFRNDINQDEDIRDILADEPDATWKLITTDEFTGRFLVLLYDLNPWYQNGSEFENVPFVYPSWNMGGSVEDVISSSRPIGYDIYKMMKQIYGKDHPRSICFDADEAQTGLQKMCGYAGGFRLKYGWYAGPRYL